MDAVHRKVKHKCHICGKEFSFKSALNRHNEQLHRKKDLKEHFEAHEIPNKSSLQRSRRDGPNKCSSCKKGFTTIVRLRNHERKFCNYFAKSTNNMEKHVRSKHSKYKCLICLKLFNRKADFKEHRDSVHSKIKYQCDVCGSEFASKSSLRRHNKIYHLIPDEYHKCSLCPYISHIKRNFTRHLEYRHNI